MYTNFCKKHFPRLFFTKNYFVASIVSGTAFTSKNFNYSLHSQDFNANQSKINSNTMIFDSGVSQHISFSKIVLRNFTASNSNSYSFDPQLALQTFGSLPLT